MLRKVDAGRGRPAGDAADAAGAAGAARHPFGAPGGPGGEVRIVVVHNRYRSALPSGEDRVVDQEHDALRACGHEVYPFERSSDQISGFSPYRKALVPLSVVRNPRAASAFEEFLVRVQPDVVHVHNVYPLLSPSVLHVCARRSVPCVVTLHNYRHVCPDGTLFRDGALCRRCVERRVALPALVHRCYRGSAAATAPLVLSSAANRHLWRTVPSAYVFLSRAQRREFASLRLPGTRCFVKGNFVEQSVGSRRPEDLVVYLGRLTEAKGVRVLMDAWDRYTASGPGPGMRLAVAGAGPLEPELLRWAASRSSVEPLGLLEQSQCADLLRRARAVVVPSEWPEPFGLVAAEAMAAGVPTIATAHGSFVDLVDHGVTGFLYRPGDPQALAALLRHVADAAPEALDAMGAAARQAHARHLDPLRNVAQLSAVYRFAVEHPRRSDRPGSFGGPPPGDGQPGGTSGEDPADLGLSSPPTASPTPSR